MEDYTDPSTIDVDTVIGNIRHAHRIRGGSWTADLSWPNVTVLALAEEIVRLRVVLDDDFVSLLHHIDGHFGLAIHRGDASKEWWQREADRLVGSLRKAIQKIEGTLNA